MARASRPVLTGKAHPGKQPHHRNKKPRPLVLRSTAAKASAAPNPRMYLKPFLDSSGKRPPLLKAATVRAQ